MCEWKELDIKCIPTDFFDNERYEVEYLILEKPSFEGSLITGSWEVVEYKPYDRGNIFIHINNGEKYRYRIKPLESMKMTEKELLILLESGKYHYSVGTIQQRHCNGAVNSLLQIMTIPKNYVELDYRKVEIITT
jgi:hypothetical protein